MASIQRIKSPLTGKVTWRAQVRVKGRPSESETFSTKKKAMAWATGLESAMEDGRHFPHRRARNTGFGVLAKRYSEYLADSKVSNVEVRKKQLLWFSKQFEGLSIGEITPDRVAEARDALAAEKYIRGKPQKDNKTGEVTPPAEYSRSGATINRYLSTLSHVFTLAKREWRLVDRNPVLDVTKRKEGRGRVRFLTDDERTALLDACTKSQWAPLRALVLLAISTGARRGELIGLKWSDVSLDAKAPRATVHETKNGDSRMLPIVGKALEALRELKLQGSARSQWVFPTPSGLDQPYDHFDGHWYDAVTAAGLSNFRFHDLRHTCASYLASQGASLLEIADTLGHRTMQMVKRYSHLAQTHKTTVIEKMAKEKGL